jgi:hypothetical protein
MTTACLLHFDGDVATMVRWIGGPHVNAHLNVATILATLKPIVDPDIYRDVERIFTFGALALCNANASEANFQAYLKYGNHQSVEQNQSVFESTIVKQSKRGLTLIMDPQMIHYALNAHLSPQGLVDIIHKRRKPRPYPIAVSDGILAHPPLTIGHTKTTSRAYTLPTPSTNSVYGNGILPLPIPTLIVTLAMTTSSVPFPGSSTIPNSSPCIVQYQTTRS